MRGGTRGGSHQERRHAESRRARQPHRTPRTSLACGAAVRWRRGARARPTSVFVKRGMRRTLCTAQPMYTDSHMAVMNAMSATIISLVNVKLACVMVMSRSMMTSLRVARECVRSRPSERQLHTWRRFPGAGIIEVATGSKAHAQGAAVPACTSAAGGSSPAWRRPHLGGEVSLCVVPVHEAGHRLDQQQAHCQDGGQHSWSGAGGKVGSVGEGA